MKKDAPFFALLAVLTLVAAWLLAHPNLIGRFGVLFYNYSFIKTFPRAIATVGLTTMACLTISIFVQLKLPRRQAVWVLALLTLLFAALFVQTWFKFSKGTYALTGAGFKTGAILLPALLTLVFGKGMYETINKPQ